MKQQIAAGILAVSMAGGVGASAAVHQWRSGDDQEPSSKPTATATATATKKPSVAPKAPATAGSGTSKGGGTKTAEPSLPAVPVGSLQITAGAVGPVQVGLGKQAAFGTGYFDTDVAAPGCEPVVDLVWRPAYRDTLDVFTNDDGSIRSIGIRQAGPRTRSGLGVGSTYESVQGVLGDVPPEVAGYGQTGLFVSEGNGWIGFLFNATPEAVQPTDPVTFIEVTRGAKPGLMRDGC
ncbi:hypothetical protein [Aeromicrobium sp.]|uniref:hypothetical protein n=1 Tax=Aeromicrobium sp. TaxID=1871063 RepID=UPI0030BF6212